MDVWLEFFGYYLSEGWCPKPRKDYRICIANNDETFIQRVKAVVQKMGFQPVITTRGRTITVHIFSKQLYTYLRQFGKADGKIIPKRLKSLSSRQLKILLTALWMGDGHFENGQMRHYGTISKRLAEDVAELLIKTGMGQVLKGEKMGFGASIVHIRRRLS